MAAQSPACVRGQPDVAKDVGERYEPCRRLAPRWSPMGSSMEWSAQGVKWSETPSGTRPYGPLLAHFRCAPSRSRTTRAGRLAHPVSPSRARAARHAFAVSSLDCEPLRARWSAAVRPRGREARPAREGVVGVGSSYMRCPWWLPPRARRSWRFAVLLGLPPVR